MQAKKDTHHQKRLLWADLVRIMAIYLVLVVHSSFLSRNIDSLSSLAIAKICIPLYVMVSGALLLGKKETYQSFFKKRFSRLLYPWVTWTLIYLVITIAYHQIYHPLQIFTL